MQDALDIHLPAQGFYPLERNQQLCNVVAVCVDACRQLMKPAILCKQAVHCNSQAEAGDLYFLQAKHSCKEYSGTISLALQLERPKDSFLSLADLNTTEFPFR